MNGLLANRTLFSFGEGRPPKRTPLRSAAQGVWFPERFAAACQASVSEATSVTIRDAGGEHLWPVADVHCASFYPNAGFLISPLIKMDRLMSMMDGQEYQASTRGRFCCLIALGETVEELPAPPFPYSALQPFFPKDVGRGLGAPHDSCGVLGAIIMDDTGEHLPSMHSKVNGKTLWKREKGCAYLSNLAVSPCMRGQGIGKKLVKEAEQIAKEWGCWGAALHCDRTNVPAFKLYTGEGYVRPKDQDSGDYRSLSTGHQRGGCDLLVKLL
ncbi:hypothetical protein BSKO_09778 [Bryopsis sp. KO-2023]|nr:hypothetical protein BSKO_09778 [Bryopsis sp. KO-2023]